MPPRHGTGSAQATEIWLVDLSAAAQVLHDIESSEPRLSAEDEVRLSTGADAAARRERRAAHIALRMLLERALGREWRGVAYRIAEHGRPSLEGAPASFSLAHTAGRALIGITAEGRIGVDIEQTRDVRMSQDRRRDIERAASLLRAGSPLPEDESGRFLQAWVRLEALGKAQGEGIGPILNALRPAGRTLSRGEASLAPALTGFAVHDLQLAAGLYGAVALDPGATCPVVAELPPTREAIAALLA